MGLCRSIGVPYVASVQPLDAEATQDAILRALDAPKPAVIVAKEPCVLNRLREEKAAKQNKRAAVIDPKACTRCGKCMELYCSAIVWPGYKRADGGTRPEIARELCSACGLCRGICPSAAISITEVE